MENELSARIEACTTILAKLRELRALAVAELNAKTALRGSALQALVKDDAARAQRITEIADAMSAPCVRITTLDGMIGANEAELDRFRRALANLRA